MHAKAGLEKQIKVEGQGGGRRGVPGAEMFASAEAFGFGYDHFLMCMTENPFAQ